MIGWVLLVFLATAGVSNAQTGESGCEVVVYADDDFGGDRWRTIDDQPSLGPSWNDKISSVIVVAGVWQFFWDAEYDGDRITLSPGSHPSVGRRWNDQVSSFRCARPMN